MPDAQTDLSRADLNLLVLFEAIWEERRVIAAARRLNLSPSAASHGLSRLRRLLNDPLFIKHPKGVVPTERAGALAPQILDLLVRARGVIGGAARFDPQTSRRRFTIGAPDAILAVQLPPLVAALRRDAPGVALSVKGLMPMDLAGALDSRAIDVALYTMEEVPARFAARFLYEEDFVIAMRSGHSLKRRPTLEAFCAASHIVVSTSGDPHGFIDMVLEEKGLARRVAMTAPSFIFALAMIAETDLVAALPRGLMTMQGERYGLTSIPPPVPIPRSPVHALAPQGAMADGGVAWLMDVVETTATPKRRSRD
jgi:DNA-binding transcriptional LysR family regulator